MIKVNKDYNRYLVCINPKDDIWQALLYKGEPDQDGLCEVVAKEYVGKPDLETIKKDVLKSYEEKIDEEIEWGFRYQDIPVQLNKENEDNFFKTFVFASLERGSGANYGVLPCPFKFGTSDKPVIKIFETFEELSEFCIGAFVFKKNVIMKGFQKKAEIDWSVYE